MNNNILVGIDIGSSNIKTVLFDNNCNILAEDIKEYKIILPKPGWAEYNPEDWWDGVKQTLKNSLNKTQIDPKRIVAIGISGLGCCTVPLDREGNPVCNAIPWSDQRAQKEVEFLKETCSEILFEASANVPNILNAIPHLIWIKNNQLDIYKKIYKYTEASGFIGQRLTNEFTMDWTTASGINFGFDYKNFDNNPEVIKCMGLDIDKYPRLHKNTQSIGSVTKKAAIETGLCEGIPVFIGGHDIIAAALAAGAIYSGQGYYSMGSASNMMVLTDKKIASPYLLSIMHITGPEIRCLDGAQSSVGFSLKWFRDQLGGLEKNVAHVLDNHMSPFEIMDMEALKTEPGSGGLIYLPLIYGKFNPDFNANSKGVFFGINPTTTRAQIIRSIMEGATYNMYETLKCATDLGINLNEILTNGGPTKSPLWCQIISDVTNTKIVTIESPEGSPFGDAILAGVGVNLFKNFDEVVKKFIKRGKVYEPTSKNHDIYRELFKIYKEVYESLIPSFNKISNLKTKLGLI